MKKRKLLIGLFSKKRTFHTAVGKVIDFLEKAEEIKEKIESKKEDIHIKTNSLKEKVKSLKIKGKSIKTDFFSKKSNWDMVKEAPKNRLFKIKGLLEKQESQLIKSYYPLVRDIVFDYNLVFKNSDMYWRRGKNIVLKYLASTGSFRKAIIEVSRLQSKSIIPEKDYINIMNDLVYMEMMFGDYQKLESIVNSIILSKPNYLSDNWYYYLFGRMYYYSLLKWKTENNDFTKYIRNTNIPFLFDEKNIEQELISYPNYKEKMDYFQYTDLVWAIQLSNFMIGNKNRSFRSEVLEVHKKIVSLKKDVINVYASYFQFFLLNSKDAYIILSFISSIKRVNSLFSFPFEFYTGKEIEDNLNKDGYDNAEYIYFILMFNIFSNKKFYYNLGEFMRGLKRFKLSNADSLVTQLRKISKNTEAVFQYTEKQLKMAS